MESTKAVETVGKDAKDLAVLVDALSETLVAKAREALRLDGIESRRRIVRAELELHRLLGEAL